MRAFFPNRSRTAALVAIAAPLLALAACDEEAVESPASDAGATTRTQVTPEPAGDPARDSADPVDASEVPEVEGATPMEERVATLGLLNKRNNVSVDLELRPGESAQEGPVIVRLEACERTAPFEYPRETGAFVQVDVRGRGESEHSRIFSGWLFKDSPSLNVVEHPIYDVWVKDCAMSFPGDE
ncbi:MAG: DUF2155 domain-containing protein [Erythrobacter sp.]